MYFDSDMSKLMQRYVGHQVTVQTHGYARVIGTLASVHESCIRLLNAVRLHELDDSRWYGELERSNQQEMSNVGEPETLISTHAITSISCEEDVCFLDDIESSEESLDQSDEQNAASGDEAVVEDDNVSTLADPIELRLGVGLISMVTSQLDERLRRIRNLRSGIRDDLGFTTPRVRIRDDFRTNADEYEVLIGGIEVARGLLRPDALLAIEFKQVRCELEGEPATEPAYGAPAKWIDKSQKEAAEAAGYTVVEPWLVLTTHLGELIRRHASQLLSYQETKQILESLRERSPCLINDHYSESSSVLRIHHVFQSLLRAGVSIANAEPIAISTALHSQGSAPLAETVLNVRRDNLAAIQHSLTGKDGSIVAVALASCLLDRLEDTSNAHQLTDRSRLLDLLSSHIKAADENCGRLAVAVEPHRFEFLQELLCTRPLSWVAIATSELAALPGIELMERYDASILDESNSNRSNESDERISNASADALRMAKPR